MGTRDPIVFADFSWWGGGEGRSGGKKGKGRRGRRGGKRGKKTGIVGSKASLSNGFCFSCIIVSPRDSRCVPIKCSSVSKIEGGNSSFGTIEKNCLCRGVIHGDRDSNSWPTVANEFVTSSVIASSAFQPFCAERKSRG